MAQTGTVKFFDPDKGYGIISPDGGGGDVHVTQSSLDRSGLITLPESQKVSFEVEPDPDGNPSKAINIRLL